MLTHSPSLPLIIDYNSEIHNVTAEDETGIMLALSRCERVQRIHLRLPVPSLQKLIMAICNHFPILEILHVGPPTKHQEQLILPSTFEAPRLRHLWLNHFFSPIGSPLLSAAIGLVTVSLQWIHPSTYPPPNHLLQPLSLLHQLETLYIGFSSPIPNRDIERKLLHMPVMAPTTIPNLRRFVFWGISAYLEALLPQMITPLLGLLRVHFFNQLSYAVPRLLQFMATSESLKFSSTRFLFYQKAVVVFIYPTVGAESPSFFLEVTCRDFDWQISSVA